MTDFEHFGVVRAQVDDQAKRVILTVKRAAIPVGSGTVKNLRDWAIACIIADHPGYRIEDKTNGGDSS